MKQGMDIKEMIAVIKKQSDQCRDYTRSASCLVLEPDGKTLTLDTGKSIERFGMTDIFHSQLGTSLEIPAKYYEKCREKDPALLAYNCNKWLSKSGKTHMIRTFHYGDQRPDVARAFLSDKYRPFDNGPVAAAVLGMFMDRDRYVVASCSLTESNMYIKLLDRERVAEVAPGDLVEGGIIVQNSEVGRGVTAVKPFLNRLVCKNGMVVNELAAKRRHVGRRMDPLEDYTIYSKDTLKLEDRAFIAKLRDAANFSMQEVTFQRAIDIMKGAKEAKLTGNVSKVVEMAGRDYGITKQEQEKVFNYFLLGDEGLGTDPSLYGLANAVTRTAQDAASYDRATELEETGFAMFSVSPAKWKSWNA